VVRGWFRLLSGLFALSHLRLRYRFLLPRQNCVFAFPALLWIILQSRRQSICFRRALVGCALSLLRFALVPVPWFRNPVVAAEIPLQRQECVSPLPSVSTEILLAQAASGLLRHTSHLPPDTDG